MGKLINRIPGSRLLISSLPGSALRTHVESLPGTLDIKRHSPSILYRIPPSNVPDSFQVITKDKPTSLCTCMGDPHCIPLDNSPTNVPEFNVRRLYSSQR